MTSGTSSFTYSGEELDALAGADNYHRWIAGRFAPYLGRRIVEAGAGIGTFARYLRERAPDAELMLVEPAENIFPMLRARYAAEPHVRTVQGYLKDSAEAGGADTVVAVNVMEHVEDDAAFLGTARRLLVPGGHVLLFVPALPAIYGTLDEAFGHFRRYTRRILTERIRDAGLQPVRVSYTNLPGVAAWWVSGRVLRRRTVPPGDVRLYDRWVIPWIAAIERVVSPPLGQSLIAVARKDTDHDDGR